MTKAYGRRLPRILSWTLGLTIGLTPFTALIYVWLGSNFGHRNIFRSWEEAIMLAILPFLVLLVWRDKKLQDYLAKSWIFKLSLAYVALHLGLGLWALHTHAVNKTALAYALVVNLRLVVFYLFCLIVASQDDWLKKSWYKIVLIPAGIVIAFGLFQEFLLPERFLMHFGYGYTRYTIPPFQYVDANDKLLRIQSTLRGANPFAAYLVLAIPAIVVSRWHRRGLQLILGIAGLSAMYFTYSRSAWLGLFVSITFLGWLLLRGHKLWRWGLSAVVVLVMLTGGILFLQRSNPNIQDTILHTSVENKNPSSNSVRRNDLKMAVKDVFHRPLGSGPGTAGPASTHNSHPARIAENYYLQIAQEVGVIGLIIFAAINILISYQLWLRRSDPLAILLLTSLVGISLINMLSHAWTDDTLALSWWGLAGIALAPVTIRSRKDEPA